MKVLMVALALLCCGVMASGCSTSCEAYCDKIEECGKPGAAQCRAACDYVEGQECDQFFDCVASSSCEELDNGSCDKVAKCHLN